MTAVSPESQSSDQANPMDEAPANPTPAQEAASNADDPNTSDAPEPGLPGLTAPNAEQLRVQKADDDWRAAHPDEARMRAGIPGQGGESFQATKPA